MTKNLNKNSEIVGDIKTLIEQSKLQISLTVNTTITNLYWQVGNRINSEILKDQRAEYGKQIVNSISLQLTKDYGAGWSEKHLRHCLRFAESFPEFNKSPYSSDLKLKLSPKFNPTFEPETEAPFRTIKTEFGLK